MNMNFRRGALEVFLNYFSWIVGGLPLYLGEETHAEPHGLPAGLGFVYFLSCIKNPNEKTNAHVRIESHERTAGSYFTVDFKGNVYRNILHGES